MAKQRYISTRFWDDNYIVDKDPIEKLLFIYLLTNPLTNLIGVYEISIRRIAFDTGIDFDMVLKILERFEKDEKVKYFQGYIALKNFTKHQRNNPKINKGIEILTQEIPLELLNWINIDQERFDIPDDLIQKNIAYDSLSHPNPNPNPKSNPKSNTNSNPKEKERGDIFKKAWKDFKVMRTKNRKPMTERAEELLIKKLDGLSNNEEEQIAILNQSIMNSWLGVFPLKGDYDERSKRNVNQSKEPGEDKYKHLEETYEV